MMVGVPMRWLFAGAFGSFNGVLAAGPKRQDTPVTVKQGMPLQKQLEAMRTAIRRNWNQPVGSKGNIVVRIRLKRDGSLDGEPQVI
jgi:hypothetical protein